MNQNPHLLLKSVYLGANKLGHDPTFISTSLIAAAC
jgi:hypothetical protein